MSLGLLSLPAQAQGSLDVMDVEPGPHTVTAQPFDTLRITFDAAVDLATVTPTTLHVYGDESGYYEWTAEAARDDPATLLIALDCACKPGELVRVAVTAGVQSAGGDAAAPFSWQFRVRAPYGTGRFQEIPVGAGKAAGGSGAGDPGVPQVAAASGVLFPVNIYAADLDDRTARDLRPDLAVVNRPTGDLVIRYNRNAAYSPADSMHIPLPGGTNVTGGDLNHDGRIDLIVSDAVGSTLYLIENTGGRTWAAPVAVTTGPRPTAVTAEDVNNDGWLDLVVAAFGSDEVVVHLNDGAGGFPDRAAADVYAGIGTAPSTLVARDLDNDGWPDLAVATSGDAAVHLLRNDGTGQFTHDPSQAFALPFRPSALTAGDVHGTTGGTYGDGWVDLVVSSQDTEEIAVYSHDGNPATLSFTEARYTLLAGSGPAVGFEIASIDTLGEGQGLGRDHDLDLLAAHLTSQRWTVLQNTANAGYTIPTISGYDLGGGGDGGDVAGLTTADVDRDGDLDVLLVNSTGTSVRLFTNIGGRPGPIAVEPAFCLYGQLCVGDDSTQTVRVRNLTSGVVTLNWEILAHPDVFGVPPGPVTLAPGAVYEIPVTFTPQEAVEYQSALRLRAEEQSSLCGEPATEVSFAEVPLLGNGGIADVSVAPDTLDFGDLVVPATASRSARLTNDGTLAGRVDSVRFALADSPFSTSFTMPVTIDPASSQPLSVTFAPQEAGTFVDTLFLFLSDDCSTDTLRVVVRGSAIADPDLVAEALQGEPALENVAYGDVHDFLGEIRNRYVALDDSIDYRFTVQPPGGEAVVLTQGRHAGLGVDQVAAVESEPYTFLQEGAFEVCFVVDPDDAVAEVDETNNALCRTVDVIRPLPDLVADELRGEPVLSNVKLDDTHRFVGAFQNNFLAVDDSVDYQITVQPPGGQPAVLVEGRHAGLGVDQTAEVESEPYTFALEGTYEVCLVVDPDDAIEEVDETNNAVCRSVPVTRRLPDLVAVQLELRDGDPSDITLNQDVTVECTFANQGEIGASAFVVRFFRDGESIGEQPIDGLAVGEQGSVQATTSFAADGVHTLACRVDAAGAVEELNDESRGTDNNEATLSVQVSRAELAASPNPFTPNGDAINDAVKFRVADAGLLAPVLKIFSFEGRLIRTVRDASGGVLRWDGHDDSGRLQRPGLYLFLVEDSGDVVLAGHVTLAL